MNVVITGASGFIGNSLLKELSNYPFNILSYGQSNENNGVFINSDIREVNWSNVRCDVFFHQAANNDTQSQNRDEMMSVNFEQSVKIIEKVKYRKLIYASSTAVYGKGPQPFKETQEMAPLTPYAESKAKLDEYVLDKIKKGYPIIGLRYCNVYGPGESHKNHRMSMVNQIIDCFLNNKTIKLFKDGNQTRHWIYVRDIVRANIFAMHSDRYGIYNCCSEKMYSFNQIVNLIREILKRDVPVEYIENPFGDTYQNKVEANIDKIRQELGFKPYFDIKNGIIDFVGSKICT